MITFHFASEMIPGVRRARVESKDRLTTKTTTKENTSERLYVKLGMGEEGGA